MIAVFRGMSRGGHRLALSALVAFALLAPEVQAQCTLPGARQVTWPGNSPVWDFCFRRPADSSGANGSGLELSDVKYKGTLIISRAHLPILNVKYAPNDVMPSPCGGPNLCYRDWLFSEQVFECAPGSFGLCTGTTTPASTVCDHPGADAGTFLGVAVESLPDRLKLTAQCQAGWYRYIPEWEFFADGTIQALFVATSIDHTCVAITHHHQAYFRLDLDVNGNAGNFVDWFAPDGTPTRVTTERNFIDTSPGRSRWQVGGPGTPYIVEVNRNTRDEAAGDPFVIPGDFPIADGWVLAHSDSEITDYPNRSICPANLDSFVNGQNVDGADVVLWVRAGSLHDGEAGGEAQDCSMVGPTIRVLSGPAPPPSKLTTVTPCRILDTRGPAGEYGGPALAPNATRTFVIPGQCGVPASAKAVAVNLTVTQPSGGGHLTAFPAGAVPPLASTLNFATGQTRANNAILRLGTGGAIAVKNGAPSGSVHLILDVTGYFE